MPKLKTDFFTVAQSGPTVDGRNIKKQWLKDAAETYNASQHLSKIWPEHMRWMPMGEVAEVRYQEDESTGIATLENRISPNDDLIYYVRQGRMNQPSIEIIEDFANTGKAYLYGLGATSNPASLGVGKLPVLFNAQHEDGEKALDIFRQRIALDANAPSERVHIFASPVSWEDLEFKQEKSIFDLGRYFSSGKATPDPVEEDLEMKKEEFKEMLQSFGDGLKEDLRKELNQQPPADDSETPPADDPEETETVSLEAFNKLQDDNKTLTEKVEKFEQFMNEEETQPGTPENTGGSGDDVWAWENK